MKKITLVFAAIVMLFFAQVINAQTIVGSSHDFSTQTWNTSGEICKVCHTPHNAVLLPDAPLWNHQLTTQTYTTYSSATMTAVVGQPDASSKLCLSCHDGTVALENFGGNTAGTHFLTGSTLLSTNLNNDHPISFTYDASLASTDGGLFNPLTRSDISIKVHTTCCTFP